MMEMYDQLMENLAIEPFITRLLTFYLIFMGIVVFLIIAFFIFMWLMYVYEDIVAYLKDKIDMYWLTRPKLTIEVHAATLGMVIHNRRTYMAAGDRMVIKRGKKVYFSGMVGGVLSGLSGDRYEIVIVEDAKIKKRIINRKG